MYYARPNARKAGNSEMPMGRDKKKKNPKQKPTLSSQITRNRGSLARKKLLDSNCSSSTKYHQKNCNPTLLLPAKAHRRLDFYFK